MKGKKLPKFVVKPSSTQGLVLLKEKSANFINILNNVESVLINKEKVGSIIPLILKIKINDEAMTKSRKIDYKNIIDPRAVIGTSIENELLVQIDTLDQVKKIKRRVENINTYYYFLSCIDEMGLFETLVEKNNKSENLKIKLISFNDETLNNHLSSVFESELKKNKIDFCKRNYSPELVVYKVKNVSLDQINDLKNKDIFRAIFSIEPMNKVVLDKLQQNKNLISFCD